LHSRYVFIALSLLGVATPARAELVFFASGRTLNVKSHRSEGGSLVLALRGGGEVVCEPAVIVRIAPDEAPYPEPQEEIRLKPDPTSTVRDDTSAVRDDRGIRLQPDLEALIDRVSAREGVDAKLVRAVIEVESGYRTLARSAKGAMGLMQLMPKTARELKVKNPFDPQQNVDAGVRHLKYLLENYNGDVNLTLAAYNAGEGAVRRSAGVPHYSETQDYVRKITHLYYGGFDFSQTGVSRNPVKVQRDDRGVLYISNTE
jgi:Transglycosylase SLT domain